MICPVTMQPLRVLYEDGRLIAASKPAGQLVIPGRGARERTLQESVREHLRGKAFVIHRLDREASGIVLFAKDAATHRRLCIEFETRKVHKLYLALARGRMEGKGIVRRPIRAFGSGRMGVGAGGKPSGTRYRVRERLGGATLLEVEPETGRRHQIRVHLYSIGHPILGDPLYGPERRPGDPGRLMLHALELGFTLRGRPFALRCEPPSDFLDALTATRPGPRPMAR